MSEQDKNNGRNDANNGKQPQNTSGMNHQAANDYNSEYWKAKKK